VSWERAAHKWRAQLKFNQHQIHLGLFASEVEAARIYDAASLLAFGEWANTNAKVHGWQHEPVKLSPRIIAKIEAALAA
jgi:hypothetical protein